MGVMRCHYDKWLSNFRRWSLLSPSLSLTMNPRITSSRYCGIWDCDLCRTADIDAVNNNVFIQLSMYSLPTEPEHIHTTLVKLTSYLKRNIDEIKVW